MREPADYSQHEKLVSAARVRPELWRLVLAIILGFVLYVFGLALYGEALARLFSIPNWAVRVGLSFPKTPGWTLALLFSFALIGSATMVVAQVFQRRTAASLFGTRARFLTDAVRVSVALAALQLVLMLLPPYDLAGVVRNEAMPIKYWLTLLPLSLVAVIIQIGSEEVFFRGYLQSQLAARFRSPLVWMVIPSAIFAAGHYDPATTGDSAIWITVWAFFFGIFAADLTARTGSLGAAMGIHFINNAMAFLIVGFPDAFGSLALYHLPFKAADLSASDPLLLVDFAIMTVSWLAARLALRR